MPNKNELFTWRLLANFWGILTAVFFIIHFLKIADLGQAVRNLAIIYVSILSIFIAVKEYARWKMDKFYSRHNGELFVVAWTLLIIIFIVLAGFYPSRFSMSNEFTATYLSILGVYAISHQSKNLKKR